MQGENKRSIPENNVSGKPIAAFSGSCKLACGESIEKSKP